VKADGKADGEPRTRIDADTRRESIASSARRLFATRGFHATTTRELAQAAGVSDALLYRHFADKQAILNYVVDDAVRSFSGLPPLERLRQAPIETVFSAIGGGFLRTAGSHLDAIIILVGEHAAISDRRFVTFIDGSAEALGQELHRRIPEVSSDDGYLVARGFFGSLVAFVLLQNVLGLEQIRTVDAEAYLRRLVATTVSGLPA
jgi:AcrR family transcriptional regulator